MGRQTDPSEPPLLRFSAALTGREQLLPIAEAVDSADPINATTVAQMAGVAVDAASRELRVLEKIGFLRSIKSERSTKDFEVVDGIAWSALRKLCDRGKHGKVVSQW